MNDLQIVVNQKPGVIEFDFKRAKELAADKVKPYKGLVVTEDQIIFAKKDITSLNNDIKEFNAARIAAKKKYLEPFDEFETKFDDVVSEYEIAATSIKKQLEVYEIDRIASKKLEIENLFAELIGDMNDYLQIEKIYDTKWENKSITPKSIKETMESLITSTRSAVETIKVMGSDVVDKALEQYKKDLSLTNAITYINRYEVQKAEILAREATQRKTEEERKANEEIERAKREERQKIVDEERIRAEERSKTVVHVPKKIETVLAEDDFVKTIVDEEEPFVLGQIWQSYDILASEAQVVSINMYLDSLGINYRRK